MPNSVLVTGATGTVGGHLVTRLVERNTRVRALVRDSGRAAGLSALGAEVLTGDLTDPAAVARALKGVDAAFVLLAEDAGEAFARAARKATDLRHLVVVSADAPQGPGYDNPLFVKHVRGEARMRTTGVPVTVVRPGPFTSQALQWVPELASGNVVGVVHPDLAVPVIDPRDVAEAAAVLLCRPPPGAARVLPLSGPRLLDARARVAVLGEVLGRELTVARLTPDEWVRRVSGRLAAPYARGLLEVERHLDRRRLPVVPTVREITGVPPRTFRAWAEDHAAAFGARDRAQSLEEAS
ncbi:NAD(P)H-binding protein [Streptomyces sp. HUCO-GS316]|uniref:SDR family oxidoreductase n=1 Tax=Streptomyces sp. HUCO-GS316 TaxID=2692198 RepID=UPI00136C7EA1|nr:NAD(P)H-binding protein [Streptomyces sp. HUCO-GS316]MXM68973.1 NAD(P)H-binding protein [Streptomyces sp. HUCO-GS316]